MELTPIDLSQLSPPLKPIVVKDSDGLNQVSRFFDDVQEFGWDSETNVVNRLSLRKIRTVQVGNRDAQFVIDLLAFAGSTEDLRDGQGWKQTSSWAKPIVEVLRQGLEDASKIKLGYNLQFDYEVALWCLGLRPKGFYDAFLVEKQLYAGKVHYKKKGFWKLSDAFARYTGKTISKDEQTSFDLENELTQNQVVYAAFDTRSPFALRIGQRKHIEALKINRVVDIENNAISYFGNMKVNGFLLSKEKWQAIVDTTKVEHAKHITKLDEFFIPVVGQKEEPISDLVALEEMWRNAPKSSDERREARERFYAARRALKEWQDNWESYEGEAAINYGSHAQLVAALRKMGYSAKKLPNTNDDVLKTLAGDPVIDALREYRSTEMKLKTFGENWYEHIDPVTGRIHSNINQIGAETGRTSSDSPNIQNIPKGSVYRASFVSRTDWVLISVDMAGAELRILADLSGDPVLLNAFNNGWDVHSMGAELFFGEEWKASAEPDCAYYFTADKQKCKGKRHKALRDQVKAIDED